LYDSPGLKENPLLAALKDVLVQGAVTRPSTAAGPKYDRVSTAYFTAIRQAITGDKTSAAAISDLEQHLNQILSEK